MPALPDSAYGRFLVLSARIGLIRKLRNGSKAVGRRSLRTGLSRLKARSLRKNRKECRTHSQRYKSQFVGADRLGRCLLRLLEGAGERGQSLLATCAG